MATGSRSDQQLLERMTERLVGGFQGVQMLFRNADPNGGETITREALRQVLYKSMGYISEDNYERMLQNLNLDQMEKISFDTFVSRFKEFKQIQNVWKPPVKRGVEAYIQSTAHPEENLRDCEVKEWGRLTVAPQATYHLMKSLREKKVDMRALLPDDCFESNGVVTKVQMRVALQELGLELTDLEFKRFWDKYDPKNQGSLPMTEMCEKLGLTPEGEPKVGRQPVVRTPVMLHRNTGLPPRPAAQAAREFATRHHKIRFLPDDKDKIGGICGQGLSVPKQSDSKSTVEDEGDGDAKQSPAADAAARAKIRSALKQGKYPGKMECIIDCFNHKFEEKYNGLLMAFKIFDIQDDGCVMRYDFRRVLCEFGFPVEALQLAPLMSRFGQNVFHGLVRYKQLLLKLMNRTDSYTSLILDERIQSITSGASNAGDANDTDVEKIGRKLVEHLHDEYIKLAVALMRSDRKNKGLLPVDEVKNVFERCLGYNMTEKQWKDLQSKLPYDAEGNVRYIDLMVSFNGNEPGAWNQIRMPAVTVPRNRVTTTPPEQVKRLERSKSEMPATVKHHENRPLDQMRKELVQFFTDNLHSVDKRFKEMDRKSHRRFSQWQFGALLRLCGFPINEKELHEVWHSLKLSNDMMSTYNNVIMEFAPNFTTFEAARAGCEGDAEGGGTAVDAPKEGEDRGTPKQEVPAAGSKPEEDLHFQDRRSITPQTFLTQIMIKTRPAVRANFDKLRTSFRNGDPHGLGSVTFKLMMEEIDKLKCGLTPEERNQLCAQFDFKNVGRCNYMAFMKAFIEPPSNESKLVYTPRLHLLEKKPADEPNPITVNQALVIVRKKLFRHWKNLRRGFLKHDRTRTGQMPLADFKMVLKESGVPASEEDLFHILTEFDNNMNGFISYSEFLDGLLKME